jgi:hypothetical protein
LRKPNSKSAKADRSECVKLGFKSTENKFEAKHHENTVRDIFDLKPEPKEAAMPNARTDRPQPVFKRYDLEERPVRLFDDSCSLNLVGNPDLVLVMPNAGVGR